VKVDGAQAETLVAGTTAQRPEYPYSYIGYNYLDTTLGKPVWMQTSSTQYERDRLTFTAAVTSSGNLSITLNGVSTTVAVTAADSTIPLLMTKIVATTFTDWSLSTGSNYVVFDSLVTGVKSTPTFVANGTGVTGSFSVSNFGTNGTWVESAVTSGSNNFIGNQSTTGSVAISGSFTSNTVALNIPVWDDIIIYATNLRGGATVPTFAIFTGSIWSTKFMNATTDIVYGAFELPHGYKEGTDLYPHLHWSPSTTNNGNCAWTFAYTISNVGATFPAETSLTFNQTGSGIVNAHQLVSSNATIPGAGVRIGAVCNFALSRPTGDTFTGDAFLHSVGVHYQIDTMGSTQIVTK
jgi:hypothetical protein